MAKLLISMLLVFFIGLAQSATMTVGLVGEDYRSIQQAIDSASPGDILLVKSGIYYENINVNKSIILRGLDIGMGKPVVDALGNGSPIMISSDGVTLDGFKSSHSGDSTMEAGIKVSAKSCLIINNIIYKNRNGIVLKDSQNNTIKYNVAIDNEYGGIFLRNCTKNVISNNSCLDNGAGLVLNSSGINTIAYNKANDNVYFGLCLTNSMGNNLINNLNFNNSFGIYLDEDSSNNNIFDNEASYNAEADVYLKNSSHNNISGNNASCSKGVGIQLINASNNMVSGNRIRHNTIAGIFLKESCQNDILENNVNCNKNGGVLLENSNYNNLTDNMVNKNKGKGIVLKVSNYNWISGNNAHEDRSGISLEQSSKNILKNNSLSNNRYNFDFYSISVGHSLHVQGFEVLNSSNPFFDNDIDISNLAEGKPIYYLREKSNVIISSTLKPGAIYCVDCRNITIKDLNIKNNSVGIYFFNTTDSSLFNNSVKDNIYGIILEFSDNNSVIDNIADHNQMAGFSFEGSNGNKILRNIASNNGESRSIGYKGWGGICLECSWNNILESNNATNNGGDGIPLIDSCQNLIIGNNALDNDEDGIYLKNSRQNTLRNNTMSGNDNIDFHLEAVTWKYFFDNDIDSSNLVKDKPIYYLRRTYDRVISSSSNPIYCIDCRNITIRNASPAGIYFYNTTSSSIYNNSITGSIFGIILEHSDNTTIIGNNISHNQEIGISFERSNNNTILMNNVSYNNKGAISLEHSDNNMIEDNIAYGNLGISLDGSRNNIIKGNDIINGSSGIWLEGSSYNELYDNTVNRNKNYGIRLYLSCHNKLTNNIMDYNRYNFGIAGKIYSDYDNDVDHTNLINGNPIYYLINASNKSIDSLSCVGFLACINCSNITVKDQRFINCEQGIILFGTSNSIIENNNFSYLEEGIIICSCKNNTIKNNSFTNAEFGLIANSSSNNTLEFNMFEKGSIGMSFAWSNNNIIMENIAHNNWEHGISLISSSRNNITRNDFNFNSLEDIFIDSLSNSNILADNSGTSKILSQEIGRRLTHLESKFISGGATATPFVIRRISSYPRGAEVFIDGNSTNEFTNCMIRFEERRNYTYELHLIGYCTVRKNITIPNSGNVEDILIPSDRTESNCNSTKI